MITTIFILSFLNSIPLVSDKVSVVLVKDVEGIEAERQSRLGYRESLPKW
jgi:hypothetical protein